jgi:hypothetical protein
VLVLLPFGGASLPTWAQDSTTPETAAAPKAAKPDTTTTAQGEAKPSEDEDKATEEPKDAEGDKDKTEPVATKPADSTATTAATPTSTVEQPPAPPAAGTGQPPTASGQPPQGAKPGEQSGQGKPGKGPATESGGIQGLFSKLGLFQGVSISGQNTLTLQGNSLEGSRTAYETQRWDTGTLVRQSSLHLEGPVWKELAFTADISNSGWGTSYSRWVAGYVGHDSALLYGDLDLSLSGNEFVEFRKSTKGWQLDQRLPSDGFMRGFYIREKGVVRNQTFVGNDTPGPYFLTYTPIIEGSEVVKVNESLVRLGTDYRLDYDSGQLTFEPVNGQSRIISASDTISVSYQSLGYLNEGPGAIYGMRAEMPLLDQRLLVGVTTLQQTSTAKGHVSDTVSYQEDMYTGTGSTGPFDTNFRPIIADGTSVVYQGVRKVIDKPLVVLVDGAEQMETVDYDAYRSIGRIIFRRAVPPTSMVILRYYYSIDDESASTGDKKLWGVDMSYQLAKGTNVLLNWANSSGENSSSNGSALSTAVDFSHGPVRLVGEYRNVDPTFGYVDTVGFQRHEKGTNFSGEWRPSRFITVTGRLSNLDSDSGYSFGYSGYGGSSTASAITTSEAGTAATSTALDVNAQRADFGFELNYPNLPRFSYQRNTMDNTKASTSESHYTTDSYTVNWAPTGAKYTARASLNQTTQYSLSGTSSTRQGSDTDQLQTSFTYNPTSKLSFSASFNRNQSSALETVNESSSRSTQLSAHWAPSDSLSMDLSRSISKTDGRVTSSYYSSYTTAASAFRDGTVDTAITPGGGDTGGDEETETPSSQDINDRFTLNWRPNSKLSWDLSLGRRKYVSTGTQGYLADSNQTSWSLGASWTLSEAMNLNLSVSSDRTEYLDAGEGTVDNRSYVFSTNYRKPGERWGAGLTLNVQDGSSPTYVGTGRLQKSRIVATNLFDVSGQLSYDLKKGITITGSAGISDYSGGYADFRKANAEVKMRYQLSDTTGVDFGYRFIRNVSRLGPDSLIFGTSSSGQNYIANTFSLTLSTNFRGGIGAKGAGMGSSVSSSPGTFGGYQSSLQQTSTGRAGFSSSGGYGMSRFDRLSSQTQKQDSGLFSSPFGGGGTNGGIGGFRKRPQPGAKAVEVEDWMVLDDNLSAW